MARVITLTPRPAEPRHHVALRSGHPTTRRPAAPVVDLFDWAAQPDRPVLPTLAACALDRLGTYVMSPGLISREQAIEAVAVLRAHFRPDLDECNARGIVRPDLDGAS